MRLRRRRRAVPVRVQGCAAAPGGSRETPESLVGRVRSREAQSGGEGGLAARRAGVVGHHGPDVALGVDLLEAVILGEGLVERVGVLARALGPLAHQAQVGRHHLDGEHQGRLDQTHDATEAPPDVLGARVTQVPEDALDVGPPSVGGLPLGAAPVVALGELEERRPRPPSSPASRTVVRRDRSAD